MGGWVVGAAALLWTAVVLEPRLHAARTPFAAFSLRCAPGVSTAAPAAGLTPPSMPALPTLAAATAGVPLLAGTLPGLYFSRALVGLGEGVAPSAATDIVARRCA